MRRLCGLRGRAMLRVMREREIVRRMPRKLAGGASSRLYVRVSGRECGGPRGVAAGESDSESSSGDPARANQVDRARLAGQLEVSG